MCHFGIFLILRLLHFPSFENALEKVPVGDAVGEAVGDAVGDAVGEAVGEVVGEAVGDAVGDAVEIRPLWKARREKKTEKRKPETLKSGIFKKKIWHLRSLKMTCAILKFF